MNFIEKYGDEEVRALSWKQPFASLMLHGKIETRVWNTQYRGWVLICASKASYHDADILRIAGNEQYGRIHTICPRQPLGHAIAIGRLWVCRQMEKDDENKTFVKYREPWLQPIFKPDTNEVSYKENRLYCHIYEDVQPIEPFTWIGTQGWSTLPTDIKQKIILL